MNCIYDFWDTRARVPTCLAGFIHCKEKDCEMCHPFPEDKKGDRECSTITQNAKQQ